MECALPFGIAPMGFSALAGYDGDVALARGATAAGTFAISSAASFTPLERMAGEGGSTWFQAYLPGDDTRIAALVKRLRNAQYDVLVVTADVPVPGNRENNARNGFDAPFRVTPSLIWQGATHPRWVLGTLGRELLKRGMPHFENMEAIQGPPLFSRKLVRSMIARDRLNWDNIALIRRLWPGKLVLKGILSPEDAELAAAHGADGIIVSNHGGRQLDGAVDPLKMLPTVKSQAGDMAVMMDCGIRRGSDVLKALALGADFVFVGRPFLFAAAVAGEVGVHHAAKILEEEVLRNMAMLGITDLAHLSADQHLVYATS
jgi:L-lactate dehydrogenase (cytochrome)